MENASALWQPIGDAWRFASLSARGVGRRSRRRARRRATARVARASRIARALDRRHGSSDRGALGRLAPADRCEGAPEPRLAASTVTRRGFDRDETSRLPPSARSRRPRREAVRASRGRRPSSARGGSRPSRADAPRGARIVARTRARRLCLRGLRTERDHATRRAPARSDRGSDRRGPGNGSSDGARSELQPLVSAHPLRERLRGQLMLALYRSGRQADALEVFRSGRRLLDEELGLKPDDELQRLERPSSTTILRLSRRCRWRQTTLCRTASPSVVTYRGAGSSRLGRRDRPAALPGRRPRARRPKARRPRDRARLGLGRQRRRWTVSRIDAVRREVIRTIGIGAPAIDLAVATDAVRVVNGSDGTVSRIDPSADAVVATIDLRGSSEPSGTRPTRSTPMTIPSGSPRVPTMCSAST